MNLIGKIQKTVRHNFLPQNIKNTITETSAVFVWMASTIAFYIVLGQAFPQLEFLRFENGISIIATYFVADGLMYGLLYRNLHTLGVEIEEGKIENYLLLPTDTINYLGFRNIQFASLVQIPIAIVALILWGDFSIFSLLFWSLSMIIGFYMTFNIWLSFSLLSFWGKVGEQSSLMYEELIQLSMFPLQIFLNLKFFWPLLPIAFVATGGSQILSDRSYWIIGVQVIILLAIVGLRKVLWHKGLKAVR